MIHWYICPFDIEDRGGTIWRLPAIRRYMAHHSTGKRAWLQILDNKCLVKADVSDALHATIMADPDFREIPATIPVGQRAGLRNALTTLGYTTEEVNATNFDRDTLLRAVASVRCQVRANANRDGIEIANPRIPATTPFEHLNRKVPG